jgi:hypothetical protein
MTHWQATYQDLPNEFFESEIPDNICEYAAYESNCCSSYPSQEPKDFRAMVLKHTARIKAQSTHDVRTSALAGDANDRLELGLRQVPYYYSFQAIDSKGVIACGRAVVLNKIKMVRWLGGAK